MPHPGVPYVPPRTPKGEPVIPYMEAKGGDFHSNREQRLANRYVLSRFNQATEDPALGFRVFRPSRQPHPAP